MTRKLLIACGITMTFFACKKEGTVPTTPANETKVPVQFNVSNFVSQTTPIDGKNVRKTASATTGKDASLANVSDLYYTIVGTTPSFHIVRTAHQTSDAQDFGVIKDSLPQGSYYIAATASSQPFNETPAGPFPEIFSSRVEFTVGSTPGAPLTLTLPRIVGLLEVNVTDATPADEVKVFFSYEALTFDRTRTVMMGLRTMPMQVTAKSTTQFSDFILNDLNTPNVTIEYKNRATGVVERKIISTKIKANNKTTVSGSLYKNEFNVMVNNAWGSNPTDTNF